MGYVGFYANARKTDVRAQEIHRVGKNKTNKQSGMQQV